VVLGYLPAIAAQFRPAISTTFRHAIWWGLGIAVLFTLTINLLLPLRSAFTAAAFLGATVVIGALGFIAMRARQLHQIRLVLRGIPFMTWLLLGALLVGVIYLAVAALGPVTNYDTGLYHLGAIGYAGDYSTITGLANLHSPFGYGTS
jgi:hypothetical protein